MIRYKIDMLAALKNAGYSTYRIRKEKLLHEMSLQRLRDGELVSWNVLDDVLKLLNMQPGDVIERVDEPTEPRD